MVGILVFANWGPPESATGFWQVVYDAKWWLTGAAGIVAAVRDGGDPTVHQRCG